MTIYENQGRGNTARAETGAPVSLDGLDPVTLRMMALYVMEKPGDLGRRLEMSTFAARCGELDRLKQHVRELEADS